VNTVNSSNPSITQQERIAALDMIRGLALFGILFINAGAYKVIVEGTPMPDYTGLNGIISSLIDIFVEKKFFSMFSFLFGAGFYIFASRAESRGDKPRLRFARRLLALLLLGIIHFLFFWGSILAVYAVIGFLLIPFYRVKASTTARWLGALIFIHIISLLLDIFSPEIRGFSQVTAFAGNDAAAIFIMFLSGFLAAKARWISRPNDFSKQMRTVRLVSLPCFIGISIWTWYASQGHDPHMDNIIALGAIPAAYFYLASLFQLLQHDRIAKYFRPIARVGQMALTNYWAQSFIGLAIISFMNLETVSPVHIVIISVLTFTIQILYSVVWFQFIPMGPLEKVWRFMTYGRKPLHREHHNEAVS